MSFEPTINELLGRARADLRMGLGVILRQGEARALIFAAEMITDARLKDMRTLSGLPVVTVTARRAATLKAHPYDGDIARIILPNHADASWIRSLADPADDLNAPMKGPLSAQRDGEASLHRLAINIVKTAHLLPAVVFASIPTDTAGIETLTVLDADAAINAIQDQTLLSRVVDARLPLEVSEQGRLYIYRPDDGTEEHYAIEIGNPDRAAPVLTRLHSACLTGDILGSLKCDCGPQLRGAMAQMGEAGAGILLYLNQEGRGIGLANKMRAYALQDQGFDTVEANHRLGFEDDERDFRIGSSILKAMGVSSVRLLTNNPAKIDMMQSQGVDVVERVPLQVGETQHNQAYLATKARKSGHLF